MPIRARQGLDLDELSLTAGRLEEMPDWQNKDGTYQGRDLHYLHSSHILGLYTDLFRMPDANGA